MSVRVLSRSLRTERGLEGAHILPTPLYSLTSGSSFGIALISRIVRLSILRSFSFDWICALTRDKARWEAIAYISQ